MNKWRKKDYANSKWAVRNLFVGVLTQVISAHARSGSGYGFERPGLKTSEENDNLWSETRSGSGEPKVRKMGNKITS